MTQNKINPEDIRLVIFDIDGVLTDGMLYYSEGGECMKSFNVKDGVGFDLLRNSGIEIAVITAKNSAALACRMKDLKVRHYFPGCRDKKVVFESLKEQLAITNEQVAYVGDDVLDLPVMKEVGLAVAPGDAHFLAQKYAHVITTAASGQGVAREVAELLVGARTDLEEAYDRLVVSVQ
ncbi:MAG: HAD-IIIA family hydrolase [Candidatus Endonucleobacter bathymodioli]|uniref:3-deoxy-D-manno-octulosonate 8-phosphate phosphatase KdsC n=1 Tax=Candidatus Endonucleibacter bathymodioli TaxID=539814 RepID=A0AA90NLG1_9GAMM|nr:HAD-IIIA family hydrolase [Candidatus Endonucleobacter bathymodioli]